MPENKAPQFIYNEAPLTDANYRQWIVDIKSRLQSMQAKAAVRVNTALLEFYWSLGRDIAAKKKALSWGSKVVKQLSADLQAEFPSIKGLSYTNLRYAEQWYLFYYQRLVICQQPVGKLGDEMNQHSVDPIEMPEKLGRIPWGHHIEIISKCSTLDEAAFYIDRVIAGNWSRSMLEDALERKLHLTQGAAVTNFADRLPAPQEHLAQEILKDPYCFDFLTMRVGYNERELEQALMDNITRFLLELGQGFAFVGRQMELVMPGGQMYKPDLIFYHFRLKCFVVVELKVVPFEPEFAGKLNFYVSAAEHLLRGEGDNQTIGLLICKSKDDTLVRWSFQGIDRPLGVASYELQKLVDQLPSVDDIERIVEQ